MRNIKTLSACSIFLFVIASCRSKSTKMSQTDDRNCFFFLYFCRATNAIKKKRNIKFWAIFGYTFFRRREHQSLSLRQATLRVAIHLIKKMRVKQAYARDITWNILLWLGAHTFRNILPFPNYFSFSNFKFRHFTRYLSVIHLPHCILFQHALYSALKPAKVQRTYSLCTHIFAAKFISVRICNSVQLWYNELGSNEKDCIYRYSE